MKRKYVLTDDRLKLTHFKTDFHAKSEIARLKKEFEEKGFDIETRVHVDKKKTYYQIVMMSTNLDDLQKAVDIIFNENQYFIVSIEDQVFLEKVAGRRKVNSRSLGMKLFTCMSFYLIFLVMTCISIIIRSDVTQLTNKLLPIVKISIPVTIVILIIILVHHFMMKKGVNK